MDVAAVLRAQTRRLPISSNADTAERKYAERTRRCAVSRCRSEAGVRVRESSADGRRASWYGVLECSHVHTCPSCSDRIRREKRKQLVRAITEGETTVHPPMRPAAFQMFTLTIRHHEGMSLAALVRGLMKAWRRCRSRGTVQRIFKRRVLASVRAFEVKHGANGWHPHLHVLVQTSTWSDYERADFTRAWVESVQHVLGDACIPDERIGLVWSAARDRSKSVAHYIGKLGLEMTHVTSKRGSRSHWDVARSAASGVLADVRLWQEYEGATRGLRCIEMDERMTAMSKRAAEREASDGTDNANAFHASDVRVVVEPEMLAVIRRCERVEPLATRKILDAAAAPGALTELAVRERIDDAVRAMVGLLHGHVGRTLESDESFRRAHRESDCGRRRLDATGTDLIT